MWVLLFFINLILIYYCCLYRKKDTGIYTRIREAYIETAILFSLFIFFQVQILSFFNALEYSGILISHVLLFIFSLAVLLRIRKQNTKTIKIHPGKKNILKLLFLFIFILLPLLYLCIYVPPNNSDANTCYLIRVEYWIKNRNIFHYPTQNLFELYYNQFPQFFIVNTRLLSGSDYFTSIFQFFSYIGSIITVSLIAKELGGKNSRIQTMAALICLCIPQAILQSTAAMYDLQAAFAASVALLYLSRILKNSDKDFLINTIIFSIAFAFTSYIKYSSLFFIIFFPVIIALSFLKNNFSRFIKFSSILTGIFLLVHLTFFIEIYQSFGNPITPKQKGSDTEQLINEMTGVGAISSGIIKNITINLITPFGFVNEKLYSGIEKLHKIINVDINDQKINLNKYYEKYSTAISESTSGNLNTNLLFIISLFILIIGGLRKKGTYRLITFYLLSAIFGFILFSIIFKFQSWNARLQLPFFVLIAAPISILLSEFYLKRNYVYNAIILCCIVSALPFVYVNYGKPIVSYAGIRKIMNKPPSVLNYSEFNSTLTNTSLSDYYNSENQSLFLHLKNNLSQIEKEKILILLDSLNYFKNEKSILCKTRNESYLVAGYQNSSLLLSNYEKVSNYLFSTGKDRSVGLVLGHSPEYPLMAMIRDYPSQAKVNWEHIRYIPVNNPGRNFSRSFYYNTIITNDSNFVSQIRIPVSKVIREGLLFIIELSSADSTRYRMDASGKKYL